MRRTFDLGLAVGLVCLLFAAQAAPFLAYRLSHGANSLVAQRPFEDYFTHALSVRYLLALPGVPRGEAGFAALGPVGDIGFAALILAAPGGAYLSARGLAPLIDLGRLNLAALLVAVRGGFGELIARYVTTQIRCYNRMSIFIEFMALFGVALLAGKLWTVVASSGRRGTPSVRAACLAVITALALWAQIPSVPGLVPDHVVDAAQYRSDREFVRAVEAAVGPGSAVFQLPEAAFPEAGAIAAMDDYSHFRPYLHSARLRWSYGVTKGRPAFERQQALAALGPESLVDRLPEAGFSGIYVNRLGFADGGEAILAALERRLAARPLASADGSLYFFKLPDPTTTGTTATIRDRPVEPPPDRPG